MTVEAKQLPMAVTRGSGLAVTNVDDLQRVAKLMLASGIFDGSVDQSADVAKACVKIVAGQEYGLTPFVAMKNIFFINGSSQLSYQLIGALIKRSGKYDFKVLEKTNERSRIEFFEYGKSQGIQEYTVDDAKRAGDWDKKGDMYKKRPRAMLYARCMSEGANTFCSEIFSGCVYTPEEFGGSSETVTVEAEDATEKKPKASSKASSSDAPPAAEPPTSTVADAEPVDVEVKEDPKPSSSPSPEKPAGEQPTSVTATEIKHPGAKELGEILQAGVSSGHTEDSVEAFLLELLEKKGVDCSSEESIFATWTFDHVTEAIDWLVNNPAKKGA